MGRICTGQTQEHVYKSHVKHGVRRQAAVNRRVTGGEEAKTLTAGTSLSQEERNMVVAPRRRWD